MTIIKKILPVIFLILSSRASYGQQTPLNPMTYWVFVPYIYNPAMVGSKDYLSVDFNASFLEKSNTQLLSANTRLSKTTSGYFASPDILEFKNTGIGASVFHDLNGSSKNFGGSATGSYQFPMNTKKLSFVSFGASLKGVYNILDTSTDGSVSSAKRTFYPNLDLGIYYYGANLYTGISTVNLFGSPGDTNSLGVYDVPAARQYFFTAGYKFILSRDMNIVLEPSVLMNAYDSTFDDIAENIHPILKFYIENFCIGTYFLTDGKTSFFAQFRYPKFYLGTFFEFPRGTPFFKSTPTVLITAGLIISKDKSRLSRKSHW